MEIKAIMGERKDGGLDMPTYRALNDLRNAMNRNSNVTTGAYILAGKVIAAAKGAVDKVEWVLDEVGQVQGTLSEIDEVEQQIEAELEQEYRNDQMDQEQQAEAEQQQQEQEYQDDKWLEEEQFINPNTLASEDTTDGIGSAVPHLAVELQVQHKPLSFIKVVTK